MDQPSQTKPLLPVGFQTSDLTEKLDLALARAQGEFKRATKDATNPHFGKKYADIAATVEACQEALAKHNLSVTQWPIHSLDGRAWLCTRVAFAGQWLMSTFSLPVVKQDPQGYGSAITYARRYALMAALGIAPEEDDDGNSASYPPIDKNPPKQNLREPVKATQVNTRGPTVPHARDGGASTVTSGKGVGHVNPPIGSKVVIPATGPTPAPVNPFKERTTASSNV